MLNAYFYVIFRHFLWTVSTPAWEEFLIISGFQKFVIYKGRKFTLLPLWLILEVTFWYSLCFGILETLVNTIHMAITQHNELTHGNVTRIAVGPHRTVHNMHMAGIYWSPSKFLNLHIMVNKWTPISSCNGYQIFKNLTNIHYIN